LGALTFFRGRQILGDAAIQKRDRAQLRPRGSAGFQGCFAAIGAKATRAISKVNDRYPQLRSLSLRYAGVAGSLTSGEFSGALRSLRPSMSGRSTALF